MSADRDIDPLGNRPITSGTARDILSTQRWSYLIFELDIINNRESPQTADELASQLSLSSETVSKDLNALEDRDAVSVTSDSPPHYTSKGCYFYAENWVELPDRERVSCIPKAMFGAVGYGHTEPIVEQVIDEYGYGRFHTAAGVYQAAVLDNELDYSFDEMFPQMPNRHVASIRRAYRYAYRRLSEDPFWAETYDIKSTIGK